MDFLMDLRWVYCLQNGLPLGIEGIDMPKFKGRLPVGMSGLTRK